MSLRPRTPRTFLAQMGLAVSGLYSGQKTELPIIETRDGVSGFDSNLRAERTRYQVAPVAFVDMNGGRTETKSCLISWQMAGRA